MPRISRGYLVELFAETGVIRDGLGVTSTNGVRLENTTAAAVGAQQMSPRLYFAGRGWETGGGSSDVVEWKNELLPVQAAAATSRLLWASAENGGAFVERLSIDSTGQVIIDQTTADTAILKLQSSTDVAHAMTSVATTVTETDDYAVFLKHAAATGGLLIQALGENAAVTTNFRLESFGGQADTTKSTAGRALVEVYAAQHDGANAIANIAADGNVFAVRGRRGAADVAVAIIDEDGDLWLNGGITTTTITQTGLFSVSVAGNTARFTNTEAGASSQVAIFEGDSASPADSDAAYISLQLSDDAGNQDEGARITWQATTVLNGATQDTSLILSAVSNGSLLTFLTMSGGSNELQINTDLSMSGTAKNTIYWPSAGVAVGATTYSIGRDADGTNQLHFNVPTGATFEWSVNDVAKAVLSTSALVMQNDVLISRDVNAGLTASTTQTQGNGALTAEINEVSVCANANDTVTLPTAVAGLKIVIINNGAQTLQIFPASGDNLGAGVNTATTLAAAGNVTYAAFDATNWESV